MNEEFIGLEEIADYCYLYEAFYYMMLDIIPKKYKVNGRDIRLLHSQEKDFMDDILLEEISKISKQKEDVLEKQIIFLEEKKFYEILNLRIQVLENGNIIKIEMEDKKHNFRNPYLLSNIRKKVFKYLLMSNSSKERIKQMLQAILLRGEYIAAMKFVNIQVSAKKDEAKHLLNAIFYEEVLDELKTNTLLIFLNLIENKKVEIGIIGIGELDSNLVFIPKKIAQTINAQKLKFKILMKHEDILVDFNSLRSAHSKFFEIRGRSFTKITNGLQHLMIKDNSLVYAKGGKNSYGNTKEIREKVSEIALRILQDESKAKIINGKHFARQVAEILQRTDPKLVMEYKQVLLDKDQGVDWIEDGIYAWCKNIFQSYIKK